MITTEVIKAIYKKYSKRPKTIDCLNFALLFEKAGIHHDILIDPDTEELTIGTIPADSPFHTIALRNINAIVPFEEWTAIVMHSSIVFLNTRSQKVYININTDTGDSFWDKLRGKASPSLRMFA